MIQYCIAIEFAVLTKLFVYLLPAKYLLQIIFEGVTATCTCFTDIAIDDIIFECSKQKLPKRKQIHTILIGPDRQAFW